MGRARYTLFAPEIREKGVDKRDAQSDNLCKQASKQARLIPPCSFVKPFFTNTSGVVRSFLGGLRLFAFPRDGTERGRLQLE